MFSICEVDACLTKMSPQRETVAGETRLSSAASNTTRVQGERGMFSPDSARTVKHHNRLGITSHNRKLDMSNWDLNKVFYAHPRRC